MSGLSFEECRTPGCGLGGRECADCDPGLPMVGDVVRIRRGVCGEGYRFSVTETGVSGHGEPIVYGENYGPVRSSDVELVTRRSVRP